MPIGILIQQLSAYRESKMRTYKKLVWVVSLVNALLPFAANASLIGQAITATGTKITPSATISATEPEFYVYGSSKNAQLVVDFGADFVNLTTTPNFFFQNADLYTFSGFTDVITGLNLVASTGFFSDSTLLNNGFSFTDHSISLNMQYIGAAGPGSTMLFTICTQTNPCPISEPSSATLAGIGLLGWAFLRRRASVQGR
jgi:hypothetical protein